MSGDHLSLERVRALIDETAQWDRLRELIETWRERAKQNDAMRHSHPEMASDLKDMSDVWAIARRECADELEILIRSLQETTRPEEQIDWDVRGGEVVQQSAPVQRETPIQQTLLQIAADMEVNAALSTPREAQS